MTLSQRAVEAAARACYEHEPQSHHTREIPWDELGQGTRDRFMHKARATITAALAVDGLCLVPKEASIPMIDAGCGAWVKLYPAFDGEKSQPTAGEVAKTIFRAMLTAASDGEERK